MTPTFYAYYSITRSGKLWSHRHKKWVKPFYVPTTGRMCYNLQVNGKRICITVARLNLMSHKPVRNMAKLHADHISNNKKNDRMSNLQWLTPKQNIRKAKCKISK